MGSGCGSLAALGGREREGEGVDRARERLGVGRLRWLGLLRLQMGLRGRLGLLLLFFPFSFFFRQKTKGKPEGNLGGFRKM